MRRCCFRRETMAAPAEQRLAERAFAPLRPLRPVGLARICLGRTELGSGILARKGRKMPAKFTIPAFFGRATAILDEHAKLQTLMARLRDACTVACDGSAATGNEAERSRLLTEVRERLSRHFAAEEHEGHYGMLVSTQPALRTQVTRLQDEHQEFLRLIDHLLPRLTTSSEDAEFTLGVSAFLERFNAHEQRENALLQDFFLRDEGGEGS
jgi:hemerythrin